MSYKTGGLDGGGIEIREIIHQSSKGAIYLTPGDNLYWDSEEPLGKHWDRSTAEAINLLTPVKTTIKSPTDRNRALKMLAAGLARALVAVAPDPDEDFLLKAREFITARQLEILQLWYLAAAVVTVVLTTVTLFLITRTLWSSSHEFLSAVLLGGAGAMISVSQRFRSIEVERYTSRLFTVIGGCSRIILGCVFGFVFLLFQKAGVVLSVANGLPFLLAAAAFVSGFSERAIPEVLEQFERQITARKTSQSRPRGRR